MTIVKPDTDEFLLVLEEALKETPISAEETLPGDQYSRMAEAVCCGSRYRILRPLGKGGQGAVFLAQREGTDGFACKIALKFFFRSPRRPPEEYRTEMRRLALQASRAFDLQHDNLVAIRDFVAMEETRVMVMEWIDGGSLEDLLDLRRYDNLRSKVPKEVWEHTNDVVMTRGQDRCALKPGVAVAILRGCLAGLAALHRRGIIHCDLKPSNVMVKRTGAVKIIDMDSSVDSNDGARYRRMTPYFMAPELFAGGPVTYQTDIASLGYTFIELITGLSLFLGQRSLSELERAKRELPGRLEEVLLGQLRRDPNLFELCRRMIAVNPEDRFADAESADIGASGAASFHRQLVKSDLWANYDKEIAKWVDLVGPFASEKGREVIGPCSDLLNSVVHRNAPGADP